MKHVLIKWANYVRNTESWLYCAARERERGIPSPPPHLFTVVVSRLLLDAPSYPPRKGGLLQETTLLTVATTLWFVYRNSALSVNVVEKMEWDCNALHDWWKSLVPYHTIPYHLRPNLSVVYSQTSRCTTHTHVYRAQTFIFEPVNQNVLLTGWKQALLECDAFQTSRSTSTISAHLLKLSH